MKIFKLILTGLLIISMFAGCGSGTASPETGSEPTAAAAAPTATPSEEPTETPTETPSEAPSEELSAAPSEEPSEEPSAAPSEAPSEEPSAAPSEAPSEEPSAAPSEAPSEEPSAAPSEAPSEEPSAAPSEAPTEAPTEQPAAVSEAPAETAPAAPAAKPTLYTFEAEYVDLIDKAGAGPSNAALETELVLEDSAASNGNYIGYTYFTDLFLDFVIDSSAAAEADMKISLASDLGIVTINPNQFEISVNGTPVSYKDMKLSDSSGKLNKVFKEFSVGTVKLNAGENTVTLRILANELYNGTTGGPLIDYITLEAPAELTWQPEESNVD